MSLRPRISLLTALLLLTVVVLAVPLWRMGREIQDMRRELIRLRNEAGYLTVENPDLVHAIGIWSPDSDAEEPVWRWRLFIPSNGTFYLHNQPFDVPATGAPATTPMRSGSLLMPGEHVFEFRLVRDRHAEDRMVGRLRGWNDTNIHGSNYEIRERKQHGWVKLHEPSGLLQLRGHSIGERKLVTSQPQEPLVLLRLRAAHVFDAAEQDDHTRWEYKDHEGPSDGVLLWISNYER